MELCKSWEKSSFVWNKSWTILILIFKVGIFKFGDKCNWSLNQSNPCRVWQRRDIEEEFLYCEYRDQSILYPLA